MARPYSLDLRERVASAVLTGESCRSVSSERLAPTLQERPPSTDRVWPVIQPLRIEFWVRSSGDTLLNAARLEKNSAGR